MGGPQNVGGIDDMSEHPDMGGKDDKDDKDEKLKKMKKKLKKIKEKGGGKGGHPKPGHMNEHP